MIRETWDERFISHADYNRFVQDVQAECMALTLKCRARGETKDDIGGKRGRLDGHFEVFWDGWKEIGREQNAMTPECERWIYPSTWFRIKAEAVKALIAD